MAAGDETVSAESEKDQENTSEDVSVLMIFRSVNIFNRTARIYCNFYQQ